MTRVISRDGIVDEISLYIVMILIMKDQKTQRLNTLIDISLSYY